METRCFDYKGYANKKDFIKNKLKSLSGKGLSSDEVLKNRVALQNYYKNNPNKLIEKGKSESKESFLKKLKYNPQSKGVVTRASNELKTSIKDSGSSYKMGSGARLATKVAIPLVVAPIPGTTAASGAVIGAGVLYDKYRINRLSNKSKRVKTSLSNFKKLKSKIKKVDKEQLSEAKRKRKLRKLISKRRRK